MFLRFFENVRTFAFVGSLFAAFRWNSIEGIKSCRPVLVGYPFKHSTQLQQHPFTQGLVFSRTDGRLLESSGGYKNSFLREFDYKTSETLRIAYLEQGVFAEGITQIIDPKTLRKIVMMLTYKNGLVLFFDYETFKLIRTVELDYVGFGVCSNYDIHLKPEELPEFVKEQKVWLSTGEGILYQVDIPLDIETGPMKLINPQTILYNSEPLMYVNDMEYKHISNTIVANVWPTNTLVEIDIETCEVKRVYNFDEILKGEIPSKIDALNGIAIDPENPNKAYLTGKYFEHIYAVMLDDSNCVLPETHKTVISY
ncbi:bifunctional Glutaminyl-peptide cyclotransferase/Quinoprotein amine dehydrogenase [Babesia duncani]|uniref:Bifunctional Glutaminyl-peptide cyclotransferase/Quinoprotein amine dehydrogenase n=1 Tax=Babesia duncani TaxID=323732 RepID=A0AAD9PIK6_9APIC|nr:bifunctional Glutaminyl-peptide cyclotransferase/Quinoprotein amine dehydrogenase [Babesia duncani]